MISSPTQRPRTTAGRHRNSLHRNLAGSLRLAFVAIFLWPVPTLAVDLLERNLQLPPTRTAVSLLRGGPGAYGASRGAGVRHAGVDIVANQGGLSKDAYAVTATAAGVVAYAQLNSTATTGYGYTVILDHGDGLFTQFSHLAIPTSEGIVKVGDAVLPGQLLGYMADPRAGILSSGNVHAEVVQGHDKIQLHFEVFEAPAGSFSKSTIGAIKNSCTAIDPTHRLRALGYRSF
jgi:murein DD-endopeptidase MepM/ murein hydrolase activator NlpD